MNRTNWVPRARPLLLLAAALTQATLALAQPVNYDPGHAAGARPAATSTAKPLPARSAAAVAG